MNWLITGGCGFIGTSLVKNLVSEGGHSIRVIDNLSVGTREDLTRVCNFAEKDHDTLGSDTLQLSPVELIVGDILDEDLASKAANGIDIIVHLAASTGVPESVAEPRPDCLTNVIGTLNYLEAARHNRIKRFIFASSSAPIGECEPPIHEELAPHPVSPYGASKLAGEAYCSAYFRTFGIETIAFRFGNVYGPGSNHKNSVVAKFIRQAMQGETIEIYGDGQQTRDFIYIDDLIAAILVASTVKEIEGQVFQIASNAEITINKLVDKLLPILADYGIDKVEVEHTAPRLGDVRRNFSDTSKAKSKLGWQPQVKLEDGLKNTVNWFVGDQNSPSF
jgi:UDP-glucose 4-epimerase